MNKKINVFLVIGILCAMFLVLSVNAAGDKKWEKMEISQYRQNKESEEFYTHPTKEGYVFAGWYQEEDGEPIATSQTTGYAYAKFVDEDVFSIKGQISKGTSVNSNDSYLRMITTVESLAYRKVGFQIKVGDTTIERWKDTVYDTLYGYADGNNITYKPTEFSNLSQYFVVHRLSSIPNRAFLNGVGVTPIWKTLDGTTVQGISRCLTIHEGIGKEASVITVENDLDRNYVYYQIDKPINANNTLKFDVVVKPEQTIEVSVLGNGSWNNEYFSETYEVSESMTLSIGIPEKVEGVGIHVKYTDTSQDYSGNEVTLSNIQILGCMEGTLTDLDGKGYVSRKIDLKAKLGQVLNFDIDISPAQEMTVWVEGDDGTKYFEQEYTSWDGTRTIQANIYQDTQYLLLCAQFDSADEAVVSVSNVKLLNDATAFDTSTANTVYGTVWSAPSTVKIMQNQVDYSNKGSAELTFESVRNEYESKQLFITANHEITGYELITSDLTSGQNKLSSNNVEVYVEKYIPITSDAAYSTTGYMPDALIPMEAAIAYHENTIAAGNNGGLWITVYVPKNTVAGTYKGTFQLNIYGSQGYVSCDIPVTLEVHSYILSDESTADSLFVWRYNNVAVGELDASNEMMTHYYDFFQDYRVSLHALPLESLDGDEYAQLVRTYYDKCSTYSLLSTIGTYAGDILEKQDKIIEQVLAIAKASSEEKRNLFDKAVLYHIDEPNLENETVRDEILSKSKQIYKVLEESVAIIKNDTTGTYAEFKSIAGWEASILGIRDIVPLATYTSWLYETKELSLWEQLQGKEAEPIEEVTNFLTELTSEGHTNICLCPLFDGVDYEDSKDQVVSLCNEYDIELWWYGCLGPQAVSSYYCNPTYHILDDNLLSARTLSWMQKEYNIGGNLYWDAVSYAKTTGGTYIDLYEGQYRSTVTGDGYLTYAGEKYGVYGPLPSMRLMSIRDGLEEYELLNAVETQVSDMNSTFYSKVGQMQDNVLHMYMDGESGLDFDKLRSSLLDYTDSLGVAGNSDASVMKTYQYNYVENIDRKTRIENRKDINTELLFSFESYADITGTGLSVYNQLGETSVNRNQKFITEGKGSWMIKPQGDYGRQDSYPAFKMLCADTETINSTFTTGNFHSFDKLMMDVYNHSDETVTIKWSLTVLNSEGETTETEPAYYNLEPHAWTTCEYLLTDFAYSDYLQLDKVESMTIAFVTMKQSKTDNVPEVYLDNIRGHYGARNTEEYIYDFANGLTFENMLERYAFKGGAISALRFDLSRIAYADSNIVPKDDTFGNYALRGVATEARWPRFNVALDKEYAKGTVLSFWMYIDVDSESVEGKKYSMSVTAGGNPCDVTTSYIFNSWVKVDVVLSQATDNLQIDYNFNRSGGYASDLGRGPAHIYMDNFRIFTYGEIW